ncbi:endo-1,4-beta-xylanase [Autumnicola edwardsiae]|uniref:Beta-xylanase n=1 Tax=Autumnicola edwardsiae TaxID=3075594 RepID=A0ABU3CQL9_9FLAO|nr:endo-1,4-beta-xylanase [Zunongwangia sp. F297]MDT0648647.1 endo-1,4-beta-xylanase [Zunongwangia sp. F297]
MKNIKYIPIIMVSLFTGFTSCTDDYEVNVLDTGDYDETEGQLQETAEFPVGFAINYSSFANNPEILEVVSQEADNVTLEYNMKHGAIVDNNGNFNFSRADEMVAAAKNAGLNIFGHTLGWHSNQNAIYLNSLVEQSGGGGGNNIDNLLLNPGFEEGEGDEFTNWGKYNGGSLLVAATEPDNVRTGDRALQATGEGQDAWRTQFVSDAVATTDGTTYTFSIWAKAESSGGNIRFSTTSSVGAQYSGDYEVGTDWSLLSWTFTANSAETGIALDLGASAMTYYLDDAQFYDPNAEPEETEGSDTYPVNGGLEEGEGDEFTGWGKYNGASLLVQTTDPENVRSGDRALQATGEGQNAYSTQFVSDPIPTTVGEEYTMSAWIKAESSGGNIRYSTNAAAGAQYSGDFEIGTEWTRYTWTFPANDSSTRIVFDMGASSMTYYVDDIMFVEAGSEGGSEGGDAAQVVDEALKNFITETVNHFEDDVNAWDVVNEPMADGGSGLRTSLNTTVNSEATDVFFWSDHLGRDWALKAFQYAEEADPEADLFINDYNLESNPAKVDSLVAYVQELREKGAKIDGIGTQMHIGINTSQSGIDDMFQKLAATGLQIKVSELDVKINPFEKQGFTPTPQLYGYQAAMYEYVINSYQRNVPAEQQYGVTFWGVSDKDSWLISDGRAEFPLLFDENYEKKAAYSGVLQALSE